MQTISGDLIENPLLTQYELLTFVVNGEGETEALNAVDEIFSNPDASYLVKIKFVECYLSQI